jgi:hypothetical protein
MTKQSSAEDLIAQNAIEHRTGHDRAMVSRPGKSP